MSILSLAMSLFLPAVLAQCPCSQANYPCYDPALSASSGYPRCYNIWFQGQCKPGRENCMAQGCPVANCQQCASGSTTECATCKDCYIKTLTNQCQLPSQAYADTTVKQVGNLILLASNSIYSALQTGMSTSGADTTKEAAVTQAEGAVAYRLGNIFEIAFVVPYQKMTANSQAATSRYFGTSTAYGALGAAANGIEGVIAQNMLGGNAYGPFLHEIGHRWSVFVSNQMPNINYYYSHWGFTALDKRGMLGGFDRAGVTCQNPPDRIPSPTQGCNDKVLIFDMSTGSPTVSNDNANTYYSKLELFMMGLLTRTEVAGEYATYCELAAGTSAPTVNGKKTVACDNIRFITVDDIASNFAVTPGPLSDKHLKLAVVAVFPDAASMPTSTADMSSDLTWLNTYATNLPGMFKTATENKATLQTLLSAGTPYSLPTSCAGLATSLLDKGNTAIISEPNEDQEQPNLSGEQEQFFEQAPANVVAAPDLSAFPLLKRAHRSAPQGILQP